jgi:hypothetical protein
MRHARNDAVEFVDGTRFRKTSARPQNRRRPLPGRRSRRTNFSVVGVTVPKSDGLVVAAHRQVIFIYFSRRRWVCTLGAKAFDSLFSTIKVKTRRF